jgi:hypothetical protein
MFKNKEIPTKQWKEKKCLSESEYNGGGEILEIIWYTCGELLKWNCVILLMYDNKTAKNKSNTIPINN